MNTLDGDEQGICSRDVGISDGDEEWLCLLYSASSRSTWDKSVAAGLDCKGLDHWRGIIWDPGIVGKRCLHVCYDYLYLIALFRDTIILIHNWTTLSKWTGTEIGYCRTITWESGCLESINPPCDVDRFFGRDEWQIKELEVVVMPGGGDDIRFLLCACGRGTSVGVIAPGMLQILVIGLLDCVGGPLGCSDWLGRLSWWAWLAGRRMSERGAVVVCPGVVRIEYIRHVLAGSSALDAAPVTGSLLFYAPVCCLAVCCCAAEFSSWVLFVVLIYLVCWMWIIIPAS